MRDYLEEHYAKPISLLELSAVSGVSPFHLSRRFRARYGLPPYMYLELVRVNRARELLRHGEPISRVAFDTGFSDQSHLTRRFKRVVGVPPGQYARTYGLAACGRRAWPDGAVSAVIRLTVRFTADLGTSGIPEAGRHPISR